MTGGGGARRAKGPPRKRVYKTKHYCVFCQYVCNTKRHLEDHINVHTTERPHPCIKCDQWFKSSSRLWKHDKVVHQGFKYICEICNQEFNDSSNRRNHKKRMHKNLFNKQGKEVTQKSKKSSLLLKPQIKKLNNFKASNNNRSKSNKKTTQLAQIINKKVHSQKKNCLDSNSKDVNTQKKDNDEDHHAPSIDCSGSNSRFFGNQAVLNDFSINLTGKPLFPPLPFKLHNNRVGNTQRRKWDSSFFLHMNRYNPEDSCFHEPIKKKVKRSVKPSSISIKVNNKVRNLSEVNVKKKKKVKPLVIKTSEPAVPAMPNLTSESLSLLDIKQSTSDDEMGSLEVEKKYDIELKPCLETMKKTVSSSKSPFQCGKCGKVLANKYSFQNHQNIPDCVTIMQIRKMPSSSLPFICYFCKKDFGERRSNLVRHIASVHQYQGKEELPEDELDQESCSYYSRYSCGFCGLKSEIKEDLQKHILIGHFDMLTEKEHN